MKYIRTMLFTLKYMYNYEHVLIFHLIKTTLDIGESPRLPTPK